jgi:hypothetical protein
MTAQSKRLEVENAAGKLEPSSGARAMSFPSRLACARMESIWWLSRGE